MDSYGSGDGDSIMESIFSSPSIHRFGPSPLEENMNPISFEFQPFGGISNFTKRNKTKEWFDSAAVVHKIVLRDVFTMYSILWTFASQ